MAPNRGCAIGCSRRRAADVAAVKPTYCLRPSKNVAGTPGRERKPRALLPAPWPPRSPQIRRRRRRGRNSCGLAGGGLAARAGTVVALPGVMKILWATDFSPRASGAGAVAGELARLTGGSVDVVHVLAPRTTDILALAADAALLDDAAVASVQARLASEARALQTAGLTAT